MRQIEADLEGLPEEEAKFLAASALLLGRIAFADLEISLAEQSRMEGILQSELDLSTEKAKAVVRLVVELTLEGHGENHLALRQIRQVSTREQHVALIRSLLAVASEDDITQIEDMEIRKVADALGFSHKEYMGLRSEFRDQLSVLKA